MRGNSSTYAIKAIDSTAMSSEVKAYNLGLVLMRYVGADVLHQAVEALGPVVQGPPTDDPPVLARATTVDFDDLGPLIEICLALDPVKRDGDPRQLRMAWLTQDASLTRPADKVLVVLARLRRYRSRYAGQGVGLPCGGSGGGHQSDWRNDHSRQIHDVAAFGPNLAPIMAAGKAADCIRPTLPAPARTPRSSGRACIARAGGRTPWPRRPLQRCGRGAGP
jgi:hypothetical protein